MPIGSSPVWAAAVGALLALALLACARPRLDEPASPRIVEHLFEALRDDSAQVRDAAESDLIRLGRWTLVELDRLARWADPERRARVESIRASVERAERWRRVETLLQRVRNPDDRARVLNDLRANDPERLERGLAALVGWIGWDRFDPPPAVEAKHDLSPEEIAATLAATLAEIPLDSAWTRSKRMAIAWASTEGSPEMAGVLARLLSDSDLSIRAEALEALTALRIPDLTEQAAGFLQEAAAPMRVAAVEYLLSRETEKHLDTILRLLATDVSMHSPAVRLTIQRSAHFAPLLFARLAHADAQIRWGGLYLLSAAGHVRNDPRQVAPLLADQDESVRLLCEQALVDAGAAEAVRGALAHGDPRARFHAARAVGRLCRVDLSDALAPLLRDRDPSVRGAAVQAVGRLRATGLARAVADLLDTPHRAEAIETLGLLEVSQHADEVAMALADPALRTAAATALARMGDDRGLGALRELLEAPSREAWNVNLALLALNRVRTSELWRRLSAADTVHPPGFMQALNALQAACGAAGLALHVSEDLAPRLRTVAYEFRSPNRSIDLLWEMSFSDWAYLLEAGSLRVVPREEAVEFWKRWLAGR